MSGARKCNWVLTVYYCGTQWCVRRASVQRLAECEAEGAAAHARAQAAAARAEQLGAMCDAQAAEVVHASAHAWIHARTHACA